MRPQARAYVRDVLNRLDSEEFYNPDLRFAAANDATRLLGATSPLRRHRRAGAPRQLLVQAGLPEADQRAQGGGEEAEKLEAEILATQEANQANLQAKSPSSPRS